MKGSDSKNIHMEHILGHFQDESLPENLGLNEPSLVSLRWRMGDTESSHFQWNL